MAAHQNAAGPGRSDDAYSEAQKIVTQRDEIRLLGQGVPRRQDRSEEGQQEPGNQEARHGLSRRPRNVVHRARTVRSDTHRSIVTGRQAAGGFREL